MLSRAARRAPGRDRRRARCPPREWAWWATRRRSSPCSAAVC